MWRLVYYLLVTKITKYTFIIRDFNAKIRENRNDSRYVGPSGLGTRNKRAAMVAKKRKIESGHGLPWMVQQTEIDYILTAYKHIMQDIEVLNSFTTGP